MRDPETLLALGRQLRAAREAAGLAQSGVKNMRQGTVSKIENGLDVALNSFVLYAGSLGLEIALLPIGQAALHTNKPPAPHHPAAGTLPAPMDLLTEFDHLKDPE